MAPGGVGSTAAAAGTASDTASGTAGHDVPVRALRVGRDDGAVASIGPGARRFAELRLVAPRAPLAVAAPPPDTMTAPFASPTAAAVVLAPASVSAATVLGGVRVGRAAAPGLAAGSTGVVTPRPCRSWSGAGTRRACACLLESESLLMVMMMIRCNAHTLACVLLRCNCYCC